MNSVSFNEQQVTPSKLLCIGRNYLEHIKELNNTIPEQMVVFNKPNSAISSHLISFHQECLHYEVEICFIIERQQLAGVAIGLDLTKRDLQAELKSKGLPWERAKAFDGAAVLSHFISLNDIDVNELQIELFINGNQVQSGHVNQMMYSPETILADLNSYTKLYDGDIIMTGTPKGVGKIQAGDTFLARLKVEQQILIESQWIAQ